MAITAYPFDNQVVTEAQFGGLFGSVIASGIVAAPAANDFKVTANSSNMTLTVTAVGGASRCIINGHAGTMASNETAVVPAAFAGASVALVVLRLDYASNSITPVVKAGTSGSSTPPSPTWGAGGIYELPIATVAVGAGVTLINPGNVTDIRRFTMLTPGDWPTAGRPTTGPAVGYNSTTSKWEYTRNGSTWVDLVPASFTAAQVSDPLNLSVGDSVKVGGKVIITQAGTPTTRPDGSALVANDLWFW